ncbi:MAG: YeeE/YedE family protein [Gammaproteobacteria bacterium]|nr:YeeE/YedE family protein [Gammaproteobacteria bacterium]
MTTEVLWLQGGGLATGLIFGIIVQRQRFCMVAAIGNLVLMRDWRHVHAFLAAFAVAIAGTQWLEASALVPVAESAYRQARFDWLGATTGGLVFGFGATLAGGCAARLLVRSAEGSFGAWIALLAFALMAAVTQFGALAGAREHLANMSAISLRAGDSSLAVLLHMAPGIAGSIFAILCAAWLAIAGRGTHDRRMITGGAAIGALVVLAWWVTGNLARDELARVAPSALNISGPLAKITHALVSGSSIGTGFGIPFLFGTVLGAVISAFFAGALRWQIPEARYIPNHLAGGAMMGVGAILAGGCNIGQGLSGVSTLSIGSLSAAGAIFAGAVLGVKWLERKA